MPETSHSSGAPNIFFIVGSPRSGTTLLQTMLAQAPNVNVPNETKFMNRIVNRERFLGPVESEAGWQRAVDAVLERNRVGEFSADEGALTARLLAPGERSHKRLLLDWLAECAAPKHVTHLGEKTPEHTRQALKLAKIFPDAKFVLILRDPRDVVLSQMKAFAHRPLLFSAVRWRVDQAYWFDTAVPALGPHRTMTIKYEELVTDPEPILKQVTSFLGLPFTEEMLDPSKRESRGFSAKEVHKLRTLEKVSAARVGQYENQMSDADVSIVQAICGPQMVKLGYVLKPVSRAAGFARALVDLPGAYLTRRKALKQISLPGARR